MPPSPATVLDNRFMAAPRTRASEAGPAGSGGWTPIVMSAIFGVAVALAAGFGAVKADGSVAGLLWVLAAIGLARALHILVVVSLYRALVTRQRNP